MEKREKDDLLYEGRNKAYIDIDRMLNEGMAGGTVPSEGNTQIGQAIDLEEEEPPRQTNENQK
ncbi:hypothetical protein [Pueribacillus sp. YX66]|uniref:hypothetical protein n=1 Tax=Pueribacillus sp. YX66 TaxID=3229242 RepID=UPI00358D898A